MLLQPSFACACTLEADGSEYKVRHISNQDMPELKERAAHSIKLTGEMTGDTIEVSKIEMAKAS